MLTLDPDLMTLSVLLASGVLDTVLAHPENVCALSTYLLSQGKRHSGTFSSLAKP